MDLFTLIGLQAHSYFESKMVQLIGSALALLQMAIMGYHLSTLLTLSNFKRQQLCPKLDGIFFISK